MTLSGAGFVRQDPHSKKYSLTLKLWTLGSQLVANWDMKKIAAPHLRQVAEQIGETVHLSVLQDTEVLYIDKIDSLHPVRAYTQIGGRAPAYCVATGKALLASVHGAEERLLQTELKRFTSRTITDTNALISELTKTRHRGYAINTGEWRESVRGLAAPVYNERGDAICAIGISGPAERLPKDRLRAYSAIVCQVAREMSIDMGMTARPLGTGS